MSTHCRVATRGITGSIPCAAPSAIRLPPHAGHANPSADGATRDDTVRINGPGARISEDLETVGICSDETSAWVTFPANTRSPR